MQKKVDTVVEDIYKSLEPLTNNKKLKLTEKDLDNFGNSMKEAFRGWALPQPRSSSGLRMSNIGKPARQLWFDLNSEEKKESLAPSTLIKFLYGHLLEEVLLFLVKYAGHEVSNQQKTVEVGGIKGHMDCTIDGEVVDVKTASGFAFKKFKDGTLQADDPFGYISQLTGYEEAQGTTEGGFLVLNKETGEITLYKPNDFDKPNIVNTIEKIKTVVKEDSPPALCYPVVPEGKSGNYKIGRGCTWCKHKLECHKDSNDGQGLRIFKYAKGLTYLSTVKVAPKVEEIKYER